MASKRNRNALSKKKQLDTLAQFGIPDIPDLNDDDNDIECDAADDELESELHALLTGKDIRMPSRSLQKKEPMGIMDIEKMANDCMKDISDEEDGSVSGEEDLLEELNTLTQTSPAQDVNEKEDNDNSHVSQNLPDSSDAIGLSLLEERLNLYKQAVDAAKQCKDASKVRRYGRAIKTLENLLKSAKSGHAIDEKDIPPVVAIPKSKAPETLVIEPNGCLPEPHVPQNVAPTPIPVSIVENNSEENITDVEMTDREPKRPALSVPMTEQKAIETLDVHSQLTVRRDQYKIAALKAKRSGDTGSALKYLKIVKKFDAVIAAEKEGQPVDLTDMPPPLPTEIVTGPKVVPVGVQHEKNQTSGMPELQAAAMNAAKEPADPELFKAPPQPTTPLEALEQRLEKYCSTRDAAKAEGNNSKARRLQRIVQQYETAIKNHKSGKPVAFEELPCPPGFAPIPGTIEASAPLKENQPSPMPEPPVPQQTEQNVSSEKMIDEPKIHSPGKSSPGKHPRIQRANTSSILDKQLRFLMERQKLFRQAALESKKNGDIQQAKEYLRMSKGFDSMIEATKNGLPIDATTIPTPPQLEADFVVVDVSDCVDTDDPRDESKNEVFSNLEKELQHQIEMCMQNKEHFMRLGDVTSASKFEKLGLDTKKDLVYVQNLWRSNEPLPIFHYETRLFSLVQCNTDLADNELEVVIVRGINLPGKSDELDSYVRIELAIPSESPQRAKTHTVRNSNNPCFEESFKFEINRKSRSQVRQFKKQVLKLEVYSKGWFFKGDTLLGLVNLKLIDLETKCSIHNSFDLMEGRKLSGGKLEIQVKLRDPLLVKQVEEVREKWLVIRS